MGSLALVSKKMYHLMVFSFGEVTVDKFIAYHYVLDNISTSAMHIVEKRLRTIVGPKKYFKKCNNVYFKSDMDYIIDNYPEKCLNIDFPNDYCVFCQEQTTINNMHLLCRRRYLRRQHNYNRWLRMNGRIVSVYPQKVSNSKKFNFCNMYPELSKNNQFIMDTSRIKELINSGQYKFIVRSAIKPCDCKQTCIEFIEYFAMGHSMSTPYCSDTMNSIYKKIYENYLINSFQDITYNDRCYYCGMICEYKIIYAE